jgi:hypothetical protein
VLLGLFFITIGMMLDWRILLDQLGAGAGADHGAAAGKLVLVGCWRGLWAHPPGWRCAPACTWRRRASSALCC